MPDRNEVAFRPLTRHRLGSNCYFSSAKLNFRRRSAIEKLVKAKDTFPGTSRASADRASALPGRFFSRFSADQPRGADDIYIPSLGIFTWPDTGDRDLLMRELGYAVPLFRNGVERIIPVGFTKLDESSSKKYATKKKNYNTYPHMIYCNFQPEFSISMHYSDCTPVSPENLREKKEWRV